MTRKIANPGCDFIQTYGCYCQTRPPTDVIICIQSPSAFSPTQHKFQKLLCFQIQPRERRGSYSV